MCKVYFESKISLALLFSIQIVGYSLDESHNLKVVSYYTVCSLAPLRHVPIVYRSDVCTIHEEALFLLTPGVGFKSLLPKIEQFGKIKFDELDLKLIFAG